MKYDAFLKQVLLHGFRMCVDISEPNKAVIMDSFPLPHIDKMLGLLHGAKVFSTIDFESAYFQLPLHCTPLDCFYHSWRLIQVLTCFIWSRFSPISQTKIISLLFYRLQLLLMQNISFIFGTFIVVQQVNSQLCNSVGTPMQLPSQRH